jgi:hypothetical protein
MRAAQDRGADTKLVDDYLAWLTAETESRIKVELELDSGVLLGALERMFPAIAGWIG